MEDLIASAETPQQAATQETLATLDRIGIDTLTVSDGTLTYRDRRSGTEQTVSAMNLTLSAPDLARGASLDGSFDLGRQEREDLAHRSAPDPTRPSSRRFRSISRCRTTSPRSRPRARRSTATRCSREPSRPMAARLPALPAASAWRCRRPRPTARSTSRRALAATSRADHARHVRRRSRRCQVRRPGGDCHRPAAAGHRPAPGGRLHRRRRLRRAGSGRPTGDGGTGGAPAEKPIDLSALDAVDANVAFTRASGAGRLGGARGSRPRRQAGRRHACQAIDQQGDGQRCARCGQPHRLRQGRHAGDLRRGEDDRPRRRRRAGAGRRDGAGHRQRQRRCHVQDERRHRLRRSPPISTPAARCRSPTAR